jgi:hypothetical protein
MKWFLTLYNKFIIIDASVGKTKASDTPARVESLALACVGQDMVVAEVPESLSARVRFSPALL